MRPQLILPGLAVVALGVAACGNAGSSATGTGAPRGRGVSHGSASRPTRVYRVRLSGAAETPRGAPDGSGAAVIAFHGGSRVCWRFSHLHRFTNATFAHIHVGNKGQSGNVVVPLSTGPRLHHQGCVSISPILSKAIWKAPSHYYVNIHSTRYPSGAVRAQL